MRGASFCAAARVTQAKDDGDDPTRSPTDAETGGLRIRNKREIVPRGSVCPEVALNSGAKRQQRWYGGSTYDFKRRRAN
ncbi:MAG TPA: hypothetical protein VIG51_01850 [Candidatus Baltobacteraceae bacterium]